jgi:N-acetylglucosaminyl-diphospho-decaprenol L-rhamnosyltransferase
MPERPYRWGGNTPDLSIILVNYQQWDMTAECIEALHRFVDFPRERYEIVIVDNASTMPATDRFRHAVRGNVVVTANERNLGFGHACNVGVRAARGDTLWLLNNDALPTAGSVSKVLQVLYHDPLLGGVSATLRYPSGEPQTAGQAFPGLLTAMANRLAVGQAMREHPCLLRVGRWLSRLPFSPGAVRAYFGNLTVGQASHELRYYDWVTAASLFMRRAVFESVGGFDPAIFLYNEDLDLCWRLSRRGYRFAVSPLLTVTHAAGGSSRRDGDIAMIRRRSEDFVYRRILSPWSYRLYARLIRPL